MIIARRQMTHPGSLGTSVVLSACCCVWASMLSSLETWNRKITTTNENATCNRQPLRPISTVLIHLSKSINSTGCNWVNSVRVSTCLHCPVLIQYHRFLSIFFGGGAMEMDTLAMDGLAKHAPKNRSFNRIFIGTPSGRHRDVIGTPLGRRWDGATLRFESGADESIRPARLTP